MNTKEETISYYTKVWRMGLRVLAGWPDDRIAAWINDRIPKSDDALAVITHEKPIYWITQCLIPDVLESKMDGPKSAELRRRTAFDIANSMGGGPISKLLGGI